MMSAYQRLFCAVCEAIWAIQMARKGRLRRTARNPVPSTARIGTGPAAFSSRSSSSRGSGSLNPDASYLHCDGALQQPLITVERGPEIMTQRDRTAAVSHLLLRSIVQYS